MKKIDIIVNGLVNRMIKLNESLVGFPELVIDGLKERVVSGEINNIQLDGCIRYVRNNHNELMSEFGGVDEVVDYVIEVVGDTSLSMGDQYFPGQTTHVDGNVDDKPFMSEDDEDIPYADQLPDEDNMYEFGKSLYDKTQNILNTVGAKIMNNLTMIEVGANIEKYKGILNQLKGLKVELRSGMDNIYDYVESKGYGSNENEVKMLDKMCDELGDDETILDEIKDVLDTMVFTAERLNRSYPKAYKLGVKNVTTDIALRESKNGFLENNINKGVATKNLSKDRGLYAFILREEINNAGVNDTQILDNILKEKMKGTLAYDIMTSVYEDLLHKRADLREINENITDPIALVDFILYQLNKLESDSKFYSRGFVSTIKNRVKQLRTMI